MKLVTVLLASVSLSAILATGAIAAPPAGAGIIVEATGSWDMGPNTTGLNENAGTDTSTLNPLNGGYAALQVGKQITPLMDFRVGIAGTQLSGSGSHTSANVFPFSGGDKVGTFTNQLAYQTLDLSAGFTPQLTSDLQVRFAAGLRGMRYTNSLTTHEVDTAIFGGVVTDTTDATTTSQFVGVGPRVGMEFSKQFGETPLGITVAGSVAIIAGAETIDRTSTETALLTTTTTSSTTQSKTLADIEASVGLDYNVTSNATLTLGVRGEAISGINDLNGGTDQNQLTGGPFLKAKVSF